jgi:NIPSNAP
MTGCCPVVELRQYTLRPGQREVLIELFDREFVESQEATGMQIVGQFRDLDRPDRFVWIRGFSNMVRRREALEAFYGGSVWAANSDTANATMVDVDDVLLLRPVTPASGFDALPPPPDPGAAGAAAPEPKALVVATICRLEVAADDAVVDQQLLPALAAAGSLPLAVFVEEPAENTFPALPVRTGEHVVVWVQRFDADGRDDGAVGVDPTNDDIDVQLRAGRDAATSLLPGLLAPPTQLRLQPTVRSRLQ